MHQPSIEPRHSVYYDYKVYPYIRPPELDGKKKKHQVALVGAGPIGMVAALELAKQGVSSVLLESERQVSLGSRAICFTRRSMEILQQVGVDKPLLDTGLPWRYGNSYFRGQRTFRLDMPYDEDDRFGPMINHQQQYLEQFLVEAIGKQPLIDLRWGHRVTEIARNDASGATLRVDTEDGVYDLDADWVVATDGAGSPVRGMLGLRMQGDAYEGRFVIADIKVDLDLPTERLAFFDPPWNPGNTVLMHKEPNGIWRVDFQLPPGETPEEAKAMASLAPRIDAQLELATGKKGLKWELDWCSVYSARAMTLTDYREGRILLSGDAGHMLPIFGVRGANTGWQDCQNLAWKLALVIKGAASERLLRSYSEERVGAAWEIIEEASKSTRFMTPPSHGYRLLRDAVLSLSLTQEFVRPLYHWRTSRPHEYLDSSLNAADDDNARFARGPRNGAQLDNIKLGANDYLLDHAGQQFQLICFGSSLAADVLAETRARKAAGLPLQVIAVTPASGGPAKVEGADLTLRDASGHFQAKYGVTEGAAYLARPDQHVCARWLKADGKRLAAAFKTALAQ